MKWHFVHFLKLADVGRLFTVVDRGSSDGDGISDTDEEGRVEGSSESLDGFTEQKARQSVLDQRDDK